MIIPPGFCEVTWGCVPQTGYREMLTSCGFRIQDFSPTDLPGLKTLWNDFVADMGAPSTFFATSVTVKVGTSDPSAPITYESRSSAPGSGSGQMCPPGTSLLIRKQTTRGGRKGRGRMYVPVVREDNVDSSGNVTSTLESDWETNGPIWLDGTADILGPEDPGPVLLHTDPEDDPNFIETFELAPQVAYQRRRQMRT